MFSDDLNPDSPGNTAILESRSSIRKGLTTNGQVNRRNRTGVSKPSAEVHNVSGAIPPPWYSRGQFDKPLIHRQLACAHRFYHKLFTLHWIRIAHRPLGNTRPIQFIRFTRFTFEISTTFCTIGRRISSINRQEREQIAYFNGTFTFLSLQTRVIIEKIVQ